MDATRYNAMRVSAGKRDVEKYGYKSMIYDILRVF